MGLMNKIATGFRRLKEKMDGSLKTAKKKGLIAGRDVRVMGNVNFGSEPYLVELGDHITISFNVSFITHDGGTWAFRDLPGYENIIKYGKIKIGDHTFVGGGTTIMPNVTIGSRCVIGAESVVTKNIPDGSVAVGAPAKVIMTTMEYAEKCKNAMNDYNVEEYKENKKAFLLNYLE